MLIKKLQISGKKGIIKDIKFHLGLNLIVDNTPSEDLTITGNSVGKTTVLKLIDFCLGAEPKIIYKDEEDKKSEYTLVKDYLVNEEILITLVLSDTLSDTSKKVITIERNFLQRNKNIRKINGNQINENDFEIEIGKLLFPLHNSGTPTFRQIISHNIRYKDLAINQTLKTLSAFTTSTQYQDLHLFLFHCVFHEGKQRQILIDSLKREESFRERLEQKNTKNAYEVSLNILNEEIKILNERKAKINSDKNLEVDLNRLSEIQYELSKLSSELNKLEIRKNLILDSKNSFESKKVNIDVDQLRLIYQQAKTFIGDLSKSFEDLCNYHNQMLDEKIKFITIELPKVLSDIEFKSKQVSALIKRETELKKQVSFTDTYNDLEQLINDLNTRYQKKGEYETSITQINESENKIKELKIELELIDEDLFSEKSISYIKEQINKFNSYFSKVSNSLYGEKYAIKLEIEYDKLNNKFYKFYSFNTNMSSGKKQGEITSFDIAYILFARDEQISHLDFLLNDKKELMSDNQLVNIERVVKENNIQFIASILKDKLPQELNKKEYFVVELSQAKKLFEIENQYPS